MGNYACAFSQSESVKYFERIISYLMCLFLVLFIIIHNLFNLFLFVCQLEDINSLPSLKLELK